MGGSSREGQVHTMMSNLTSPRSQQKLIYHPLIHTLLEFNLAQDVERCQVRLHHNKETPTTPAPVPGTLLIIKIQNLLLSKIPSLLSLWRLW